MASTASTSDLQNQSAVPRSTDQAQRSRPSVTSMALIPLAVQCASRRSEGIEAPHKSG